MASSRSVWYFAYGANMSPAILEKRGVSSLAQTIALLPGFCLSFDLPGVPYSEPAMANIRPLPSDDASILPVHGVAYKVSQAGLKQIIATEGGGVAYRVETVEARAFERTRESTEVLGGEAIEVVTLVARHPMWQERRPSARYLVRA